MLPRRRGLPERLDVGDQSSSTCHENFQSLFPTTYVDPKEEIIVSEFLVNIV